MSDRTWAGHGISSSAKRRKCLPTDGGSVAPKSTLSTSNPSTSVNSGTKNTESYRGEGEYLLKGANSLSNTAVLSTDKNLRFRNPSNRASATTIAKAVSTTASVSTADNGPGSSVPVPPVPHDCHYRKPSFTAPSLSSRLIRTMCFLAFITCTDLLSIPSADAKSKS